jgi:DNA invertase Pin-like site-specific DNA recombinase
MQAIAAAQRSKSILLVATISRLSRDVGLISTLINDANVRFMSAETGIDAQPFEIYLRAVFADEEKRKISIRTRGALAALKRAGVKLGNPNLSDVRPLAWAASRAKADKHANQYMDLIKAFRRNGKTYGAIANVLNDMGAKTSRGGKWYGTTVRNIEKRAV